MSNSCTVLLPAYRSVSALYNWVSNTWDFRFLKILKTLKVQFRVLNLISERHIQILIVICEIHQLHLHFSVFV